MSNLKQKIDFVNGLYGLIIEANLKRSDEEVLSEINVDQDQFLSESHALIKRLNTKATAQLNKSRLDSAKLVLEELMGKAGSNLEGLGVREGSRTQF